MTNEGGWGLRPRDGTTPRLRWGARAIYYERHGEIDLVWDRQGFDDGGTAQERQAMADWINGVGVPALRAAVKAAKLGQGERRVVALEIGDYVLEANPNGSYGYLYIGIWKKEPA